MVSIFIGFRKDRSRSPPTAPAEISRPPRDRVRSPKPPGHRKTPAGNLSGCSPELPGRAPALPAPLSSHRFQRERKLFSAVRRPASDLHPTEPPPASPSPTLLLPSDPRPLTPA